jgi:hypothetical protein
LINQTLANILSGTGQAGQIVIDQLMGAVTGATHQGQLLIIFKLFNKQSFFL